jgi:hypothetical protein
MDEGKTRLDSSDLHMGCRRAMQYADGITDEYVPAIVFIKKRKGQAADYRCLSWKSNSKKGSLLLEIF